MKLVRNTGRHATCIPLAQSAVGWALFRIGRACRQAKRSWEDIFARLSLAACACPAQADRRWRRSTARCTAVAKTVRAMRWGSLTMLETAWQNTGTDAWVCHTQVVHEAYNRAPRTLADTGVGFAASALWMPSRGAGCWIRGFGREEKR